MSRQMFFCEGAFFMRELSFRIWRNQQEQNWSIEINGKSYEFISLESVNRLVKDALIDAAESVADKTSHTQ